MAGRIFRSMEWLIWWVKEINKMEGIMWIAMLFQLTVIEAINE